MCSFYLAVVLATAGQMPDKPRTPEVLMWNCQPADRMRPETWNFLSRGTGGLVEAIGKDHLTLYRPAGEFLRLKFDPQTGQQLDATKTQQSAWPAKRFALGEDLAKGEYSRVASPERTYRIGDVRVGDWVVIEYDRINGVDTCKTICIHRRAGGFVPPAPGEKPSEFRKHHEQVNADQDWEERRIAYPRKYWPTYLGKDGNFYAAPFPSESVQFVVTRPVAPAPREAKPRP